MADSRRETILEAARAALEKAGKPAELTVHRHRTRPIEQDQLPAVVLLSGVERVSRLTHDRRRVERELIFRAECRGEGEPSDQVLDPYLTWVTAQLMSDPDLAALIRSIEERQTVWDQAPAKKAKAAAAIEFAVRYETLHDDPTSHE